VSRQHDDADHECRYDGYSGGGKTPSAGTSRRLNTIGGGLEHHSRRQALIAPDQVTHICRVLAWRLLDQTARRPDGQTARRPAIMVDAIPFSVNGPTSTNSNPSRSPMADRTRGLTNVFPEPA